MLVYDVIYILMYLYISATLQKANFFPRQMPFPIGQIWLPLPYHYSTLTTWKWLGLETSRNPLCFNYLGASFALLVWPFSVHSVLGSWIRIVYGPLDGGLGLLGLLSGLSAAGLSKGWIPGNAGDLQISGRVERVLWRAANAVCTARDHHGFASHPTAEGATGVLSLQYRNHRLRCQGGTWPTILPIAPPRPAVRKKRRSGRSVGAISDWIAYGGRGGGVISLPIVGPWNHFVVC